MESLANKYRPKAWAEVVGQNSTVSILSRQIATNTMKNAYLFVGPAGCGKTTVARIFSNDVNKGMGEPIEIDAASNNGVDNIRAIINEAQQLPLDCDFKVFVLDECHQLTKAAWDAALKLIEEPPLHAIFIFCTTNVQKIPDTILSRVQRFDFKRVDKTTIADRLEYILNEEVVKNYERPALERIAIRADGHVRNAITMLDTCLSYSDNLTVGSVESALGLISMEAIIGIENNLIADNIESALKLLDVIKLSSSNMVQVYDDIMNMAVEYCLYQKVKSIELCSISKDFESCLLTSDDSIKVASAYLNRLMEYRKYIDERNAEFFIRTVFYEVCNR